MSKLNPREAIDAFWRKEISANQMQRIFASYSEWLVPATLAEEPVFLKFDFGKNDQGMEDQRFFLFTDREAYDLCREKIGREALGEYFIVTSGSATFANVNDDVMAVNINPFSPGELHYVQDQIPELRAWASILKVESILDSILHTNKGFAQLRAFPQYAVVGDGKSENVSVACAPDAKGRRLAALFTSDDAVDAYFESEGGDDRPVYSVEGEAIFETLRNQNLDGVVFNCRGPIPARAFAAPFIDLILTQER